MRSSSSQSFSPQDDLLPKSEENATALRKEEVSPRKKADKEPKQLLPIDETEEFHDPFSDLSLFLARSIKEELLREKNPKKWSHKIASLLFKEILPEFTKKFPTYRLGQNALKKTWEKVRYYLDRFAEEKKALYPNGKLNIEFLIKKNLSSWKLKNPSSDSHPYQTATKLAGKISECIALINGERPSLEKLTKTIWSMQKHLLSKKEAEKQSPPEHYDPLDRIIVRIQLEELAKNPTLSSVALGKKSRERLIELADIAKIDDIDASSPLLSPFLASTHIDHPEWSCAEIISETIKNLKRAKNINFSRLDEKIRFWSLQHDMVASFLSFTEEPPYLALLQKIAPANSPLSLQEIKAKVVQEILIIHPSLSPWKELLEQRIVILYKYLWYTSYRKEEESSYQRFLKWHEGAPSSLMEKMVPLMPMDQG